MDLMPFWEKFGFPAAILVAGGIALWKTAQWFGKNIAEPLVATHVDFVETVKSNDHAITEMLKTHSTTQANILDLMRQFSETQKTQLVLLQEIKERWSQMCRHPG